MKASLESNVTIATAVPIISYNYTLIKGFAPLQVPPGAAAGGVTFTRWGRTTYSNTKGIYSYSTLEQWWEVIIAMQDVRSTLAFIMNPNSSRLYTAHFNSVYTSCTRAKFQSS